jgi:hypothetical protein
MPSANGTNGTNGSAHAWTQLPEAMGKSVKGLQKLLEDDPQWQAFVNTNAVIEPVTMGVASKVSARARAVDTRAGLCESANASLGISASHLPHFSI